jgi:hypothetical protein
MEIQNIHNPKFTQQISKNDWEKLGTARQKSFRVLNSEDSPALQVNIISNDVPAKAEKQTEKEPEVKEPIKAEVKADQNGDDKKDLPGKDHEKKRDKKE